MLAALSGGPVFDFDFSEYCFRAIAVPAAVFGGPFLDFDCPKYCFRAIAVPTALFGSPFFGGTFLSVYRSNNEDFETSGVNFPIVWPLGAKLDSF